MARNINDKGWQKKSITNFYKSVAEVQKDAKYKKYTDLFTTKDLTTAFEWLGDFPGMVKTEGDIIMKAMLKNAFSITVDPYHSALQFTNDEFNDSPDFYKKRIGQLPGSLINHPTSLMFSNLVANNLAYDGQSFFSTTHVYTNQQDRRSTYSNLVTGSGITSANIQTDFTTGRLNLRLLKQRNGDPLFADLGEITITCSPALETVMDEVFNQPNDGNNAYYKKAVIDVDGNLTGNDWYMSLLTKPMKPFVFLEREALKALWNYELILTTSKFSFQASARYTVGNGFPQLMQKIDN